jgi:hypothetical protein
LRPSFKEEQSTHGAKPRLRSGGSGVRSDTDGQTRIDRQGTYRSVEHYVGHTEQKNKATENEINAIAAVYFQKNMYFLPYNICSL